MLPVLLFSRVRISNSYAGRRDRRTTKIVNRQLGNCLLPPTQTTSPIQPSSSIFFAVGFIRTYWTLLHKEWSNWLLLVKKMGSRQKAVKMHFGQFVTTPCWIDGSPTRTQSIQIKIMARTPLQCWTLTQPCPHSVCAKQSSRSTRLDDCSQQGRRTSKAEERPNLQD